MLQDEYAKIEARVFGTSSSSKSTLLEKTDSSKKRKSQSPQAEGPVDKKARKDKTAAGVEKCLPATPPSNHALNAMSSDEDGIPNVLTRKRKSILQPSGGKTARKTAGRRKSVLAMNGTIDISQREEGNEEDSQSSDESPITTIRSADNLELITNPPIERSPADAHGLKYFPRKYLELSVVEYDLPLTESQGPGDLWTCTFDGCFHRVHEASNAHGKARIMEHFKAHATQAQEKIDLALNESRPYLPVK